MNKVISSVLSWLGIHFPICRIVYTHQAEYRLITSPGWQIALCRGSHLAGARKANLELLRGN